jgi:glutathione S-transferase
MKLYGFPPSPNTWKVRAVAAHLGIPLELEFVDLSKGESHSPDYLAINPTGRTPTLVDGDLKLWESTAIMQYLASQKPNSLWPDNARARADIARWQSWQLAHFSKEGCEPLIFNRLVKKLLNLGAPDEAAVAKGDECFNKEAKVLDAHLAKQPYLVGRELTLADLSVAAPLFYSKEADLPVGAYPRVQEWFNRVAALPCWSATAPQRPAAAA